MKRKALFLDRDGVINIDTGYLHTPEQCVFVDGIVDLIRHANAADYVVAVVTNQAGIARGYFSAAQFTVFTDWMIHTLEKEGARIDRVYHCPHHPDAGIGELKRACDCRKPQPGMLLQAQKDFDLDMANSLIIGDKMSDLEAAKRAGVATRLLYSADLEEGAGTDVRRLSSLLQALPFIEPRSHPKSHSA